MDAKKCINRVFLLVNKCNGMRFTFLLRMGLYNCINKPSFKHNRKIVSSATDNPKITIVAVDVV